MNTPGLDLSLEGALSLRNSQRRPWLRIYSKFVCAAVLFLIFMGALVTSHDAGLSVPDWPTTYGENMFLYSPAKWVGPIFYEHVHRLVASAIGLLTVVLTIWIWRVEKRRWVKLLALLALGAVVVQGLLGGLTVLLKLPDAVSIAHGMLAQTFFCILILIAYSQSQEYQSRLQSPGQPAAKPLFPLAMFVWGAMYVQLFLGALMRHSSSGLAIPDFPTMGGQWIPHFDSTMLSSINELRSGINYAPVTMQQVLFHFVHRAWALVVVAVIVSFLVETMRAKSASLVLRRTAIVLGLGVLIQFLLGVATVLSVRQPYLASVHVMIGALLLGVSVLAALRAFPVKK